MKLNNLINTLKLCTEFHKERGNETKVSQLENKIEIAESKTIETSKDIKGIYLGEGK